MVGGEGDVTERAPAEGLCKPLPLTGCPHFVLSPPQPWACRYVGVCFGEAVGGKEGMNGVEPAWPRLWIRPSSDVDCPCVLNTSLMLSGLFSVH